MIAFSIRLWPVFVLGLACAGLAGCGGSSGGVKSELPAPWVTVAPPTQRLVTRYEYATGRVEAVDSIDVRARISGYLVKILFEPGSAVTKNQKLYEIDPLPFKADLEKAKASKAVAEADEANFKAELIRATARADTTKKEYDRLVLAFDKNAASAQERDKGKGDYDEAAATVTATKAKINSAIAQIALADATVDIASLNLGYCTIRSPIDGVIGDKQVAEGNLVSAGVTTLTTIVSVDPIDIGFDVDENTLQQLRQAVLQGKIKVLASDVIRAEGGLSVHGSEYPLVGYINFSNNRVDKKTGTIHMKARFPNPKPPNGPRLLTPGMFARVRVPIGEPTQSWLVPDAALGSDQGIRFLYLLGPENKAIRIDTTLGTQVGDLRVIEAVQAPGDKSPRSLAASDQIIVSGIQRVRPGLTVDPKPATK